MLTTLVPERVWYYFDQITRIPRPSGDEAKIGAFLQQFAKSHGLACKIDKAGNICIIKPAKAGYEHMPTLVLQSHMDMVCEKNAGITHDFTQDPIQTYIDGDWVKARGTTLGADNGIGLAAQLAVLEDTTLKHGQLECLITVDEERGLTGAKALEPGFITGKTLINLDSEEEGEFTIGCAGGMYTIATYNIEKKEINNGYLHNKITVSGLKGGHSGEDINKGLANANKVLVRLLGSLLLKTQTKLVYLQGGNLRNAIAREAFAHIAFNTADEALVKQLVEVETAAIKSEYQTTEPHLTITLAPAEHTAREAIIPEVALRIIRSLIAAPHGVLGMSKTIPGLVETSTNLASIRQHETTIVVETSQRSSQESLKQEAARQVSIAFALGGAQLEYPGGYPGWKPNIHSTILKKTESIYYQLFNQKPMVKAIHAGLECGLFLEKYPELDMVSFGPTIEAPHSPDERVKISTVERFYRLLTAVVEA